MRYGIISDIHSNLEALLAVLAALSKERIDSYICIGDIVGYGADPYACINEIKKLDAFTVLGNHDAGCIERINFSEFNDNARNAVIWTKNILSASHKEYLGSLPYVLNGNKKLFSITHGTLIEPDNFNYMFDTYQAQMSFGKLDAQILFVGHSHVPGVYEKRDEDLRYYYYERIKISRRSKYIVNAGSVGQPRDGDPRASYVILDDENLMLDIKRVPYDFRSAQGKILKAGLPPFLAHRLEKGM